MNEKEISMGILDLVKNNILLKLRFLEIMIFRLDFREDDVIFFGTDGKYIYYNSYIHKTNNSFQRTDLNMINKIDAMVLKFGYEF